LLDSLLQEIKLKMEKIERGFLPNYQDYGNFDVRLVCPGFEISCHRLVLAASSLFFKRALRGLFFDLQDEPLTVVLPDFTAEELVAVIDLLYGRKVYTEDEPVPESFKVLQIGRFAFEHFEIQRDFKRIFKTVVQTLSGGGGAPLTNGVGVVTGLLPDLAKERLLARRGYTGKKRSRAVFMPVKNENGGGNGIINKDLQAILLGGSETYENGLNHTDYNYESDRPRKKQATKISEIMDLEHPCDQCEYVGGNYTSLYQHKKRAHENDPVTCDICDFRTVDTSSLKRHRQTIHEGVKYPCDQCEHKASDKGNLARHKQTKHENVKYPCDLCEYSATRPSYLKRHIMIRHEGLRHPCERDECDFSGISTAALQDHMRSVHEGTRYNCEQCDFSAVTKSGVRQHIKRVHEGVTYPCDKCDYEATQASSLKIHKENKHEGRRYPCDDCDYCATEPSSLKRHMKTKHGVI